MPNLNPRIERLKAMLGLEEKRAALHQQLDALQKQLLALKDSLFDDSAVAKAASPAKSPAKPKGRAKRGSLKRRILTAMESAGSAGVRVTDLAQVLSTKAANIHAWFHSTGKRIPGIVKVAGGHYRMKGDAAAPAKAPAAAKAKPAAKTKSKGGKRKGAKRGELSAKIQAALAAAGKNGLSIKDLAGKVGAKYRNVSVWLVTTGKQFTKIKKTGPAHYQFID